MPLPASASDPPHLHLPARLAAEAQAAPLRGLTILMVEDSRFASDALRLLCQRSGARLRRAETLRAARAHLRLYRPDVVMIDLGLPDGRGEALIRELALGSGPRPVLLGLSGDPSGRAGALAAGADGFVEKPVPGLAAFQTLILRLMPGAQRTTLGHALTSDPSAAQAPDPLALHDDLVHAAALIEAGPDAASAGYVAGFVQGVARVACDPVLEQAAGAARQRGGGLSELAQLISARLKAPVAPLIAPRPAVE